MLMAMPLLASRPVKAEPVNCEPWSVLKISGLPWRAKASSRGSTQKPHDREVGRRQRARQIINAAAADLQNVRLLGDRQIVLAVDHRFALSNPALVSAPSKKSFSSVSSPILACSDFTSTAGVTGAGLPVPNTLEAPPSSCAFQAVP